MEPGNGGFAGETGPMGNLISPPEPLNRSHSLETFDCGVQPLNDWLRLYALQNQKSGGARTFVAHTDSRVVGFFSLATGGIDPGMAPPRVAKGMARHPIPVIILARLAVDLGFQGAGLGRGLLREAVLQTLYASKHAGIRALLVHSKNENARNFYLRFGFQPSPLNPNTLIYLLKDARRHFS